jgi:uncharacterized small protein (DUF1192 family)
MPEAGGGHKPRWRAGDGRGTRARGKIERAKMEAAMDWDDLKPKPARTITIGENLETLSVGELESRLEALRGEILRVEAEIAGKRKHTAAADALFAKSK